MPVEVLKEVRLVGETFNYVKGTKKKKKNTMGEVSSLQKLKRRAYIHIYHKERVTNCRSFLSTSYIPEILL